MKDIRRVFEYHGAERKVVFNYESGAAVTVENAQKIPDLPSPMRDQLPGGSAGDVLPGLSAAAGGWILAAAALRIALLPVVAGISYEIIRFAPRAARDADGLISMPGLWLQRITTHRPTIRRPAVAIHALERRHGTRRKQGGELIIA